MINVFQSFTVLIVSNIHYVSMMHQFDVMLCILKVGLQVFEMKGYLLASGCNYKSGVYCFTSFVVKLRYTSVYNFSYF